MRKLNNISTDNKLTVGTEELMAMLGVGKNSAAAVGEEAGAVIRIGRRKLYSVKKIEAYLEKLQEA